MTYAYRQTVPIGEQIYEKISARLGPEPMDGLILHLVIRRSEHELEYIDVWDSPQACEQAFEQRIHPAVYGTFSEIGFRPDGEPEKSPLQVIELRGAAVSAK